MQENLDYKQIIVAAAQKIITGEASQVLGEEKVAALEDLYSRCESYLKDGYVSSLVTAISRKKSDFILGANTKTELKEIMQPPKVRYNGNEVVSSGEYSILEEEAIIWSKTSLQAPLNEAGFQRYLLLVKKFFPEKAKEIFGDRYPHETGVIEINDSAIQIIETDETAKQVTEVDGEIIPESNTAATAVTVIETDENTDIIDELDGTAASEDTTDEDIDTDSETDDENEDMADDTDGDETFSNENDEESENDSVEAVETTVLSAETVVKTAFIELNENTIIQAIEKIEKEANTSGGQNVPAIPIYNHLKKICEKDMMFASFVNQEHKTLLKCFNYVYEQVKKTIVNQTGTQTVWVSDDATYKMAEDYYLLDDAEIERQREEEKKKREAERNAAAEKRKAEQAKRDAERKNKNADKTASGGNTVNNDSPVITNKITKPKENDQLALFGLDEEESA